MQQKQEETKTNNKQCKLNCLCGLKLSIFTLWNDSATYDLLVNHRNPLYFFIGNFLEVEKLLTLFSYKFEIKYKKKLQE